MFVVVVSADIFLIHHSNSHCFSNKRHIRANCFHCRLAMLFKYRPRLRRIRQQNARDFVYVQLEYVQLHNGHSSVEGHKKFHEICQFHMNQDP